MFADCGCELCVINLYPALVLYWGAAGIALALLRKFYKHLVYNEQYAV